jgi:hypothetical protein
MQIIECLSLSLDSGICCVALGPLTSSAAQRLRLAVAFGACDMAATALGSLAPQLAMSPSRFPLYLCCALLVGLAGRFNRTFLYASPAILSLDNLVSGQAPETAICDGLGSAALALLGMAVGEIGARAIRKLTVA